MPEHTTPARPAAPAQEVPIDARRCLLVMEKEDGAISTVTPYPREALDEAALFAQSRAQSLGYVPHPNGDLDWVDQDEPGAYAVFVFDVEHQCCPPRPGGEVTPAP